MNRIWLQRYNPQTGRNSSGHDTLHLRLNYSYGKQPNEHSPHELTYSREGSCNTLHARDVGKWKLRLISSYRVSTHGKFGPLIPFQGATWSLYRHRIPWDAHIWKGNDQFSSGGCGIWYVSLDMLVYLACKKPIDLWKKIHQSGGLCFKSHMECKGMEFGSTTSKTSTSSHQQPIDHTRYGWSNCLLYRCSLEKGH